MMQIDTLTDGDESVHLLELRCCAAQKAVRAAQTECDLLLQVIEQAQRAWRLARARLDAFEKLRDAFDEHLEGSLHHHLGQQPGVCAVMSAA